LLATRNKRNLASAEPDSGEETDIDYDDYESGSLTITSDNEQHKDDKEGTYDDMMVNAEVFHGPYSA
jgi:hypothetical protein